VGKNKLMKIVKLTFNFDFPVFRQTPGSAGVWGDYKFIIDPQLKECDFWVVYTDYQLQKEKCLCNRENIIFIPGESRDTSPAYSNSFLKQFGKIITVQKEITGSNVVYWQNANPWFIERSYDQLSNLKIPEKDRVISIVSSDKVTAPGHRLRTDFAQKIKSHFKDKVDFYGRGIADFKTKWEVTAPYKYHIAIENAWCEDWVTEKFFDPLLTYTYPVYYGCPNLEKYISANSFARIDIQNFKEAVQLVESLIEGDTQYAQFLEKVTAYRDQALNIHQLFPMIAGFLDQMDPNLKKTLNKVSASPDPLIRKLYHMIVN
jgi:hypothetical protein